jgi:hypothetical protein
VERRAAELIRNLGLTAHPEGGYYSETFRSPRRVRPEGAGGERSAATVIFFLLPAGEQSRWHSLRQDEIWQFVEGAPLDLHLLDPDLGAGSATRLGPVGPESRPVGVVPGGWWQAARSRGAYTLVVCTVAPGFEFEDFRLMQNVPGCAGLLRERFPDLTSLL